VVQESLTKVARHAHATSVSVSALIARGELRVRVEDDGVGLRDNVVTTSLGIAGMRERIEAIGGRFDIRPGSRRGTAVCVTVPVAGHRAAPARRTKASAR